MKKLTYSLAAIGIIAVAVLITFFRNTQSPLPPWDGSSEYKYHRIESAIYLQVVRHDEYIYVSQYGIWFSDTPELVKRSDKHNEARNLREIESHEEFEKARLAFLEWEEKYNTNKENQVYLTRPQESHTIPQTKTLMTGNQRRVQFHFENTTRRTRKTDFDKWTSTTRMNISNQASHTMAANARLFHNDPMKINLNRLGASTEAAIVWI